MCIIKGASFIFDTGANYLCSSNKGDSWNLKSLNSKEKSWGLLKALIFFLFGDVEYYAVSEIWRMVVLRYQACYVPGLSKGFLYFPQKTSSYQKDAKLQLYLISVMCMISIHNLT